jgi:hypothetical protein
MFTVAPTRFSQAWMVPLERRLSHKSLQRIDAPLNADRASLEGSFFAVIEDAVQHGVGRVDAQQRHAPDDFALEDNAKVAAEPE